MTEHPSAKPMPFLDHLSELRRRLLAALAVISAAAVICYMWAPELFRFLTKPLSGSGFQAEMIGTGPAEAFVLKLQVSVAAGVLVSLPFTFFQLWLFVAPGLTSAERRLALPFVFFSTFFFMAGAAFCHFAVFPAAFGFFLAEYASIGVSANLRVNEYLSFVVKLLLVFGCVFELPVLSFFLARAGMLTDKWLIKNLRYAIVVIFAAAAVLTPPDVLSQVLLAVPLLLLYALCIPICRCAAPKPPTP